MFFDRSGGPEAQQSESFPTVQSSESESARVRRRRIAAIGLAAAMAVPAAFSQVSRLYAGDAGLPKSPASPSAADLLKKAVEQFDHRQFEEADETLRKIDTRNLSESERQLLIRKMAPIDQAARERRTARLEFESGTDDAKAGRAVEARAHFQAVIDNEYADPHLIRRARTALGLALDDALPGSAVAAADNQAGVPTDPAASSTGGANPTTAPATAPTTAPSAPMTGRDHYERGVREYRDSDWANAKRDFQAAIAAGYTNKPDNFHESAQTYLDRMNGRQQADHGTAAAMNTAAAPAPAPSRDPAGEAALNAVARAEDLQREQAQLQAAQLVKAARDAQNNGNLDEARNDFQQAVRLDPLNAQAQAGLDDVLNMQGRNPREGNAAEQFRRGILERVQEITYRFNTAINEARDAVQAHDWNRAEAALQRAKLASSTDRAIFSPSALREFDTTIANTQLYLDQERQRLQMGLAAQNDQRAAEQIRRERLRAQAERERTIRDLKKTAQDLIKQARYREALGVIDQVLALDPTDEYAVGVRPWIEDKWQFQVQRNDRDLRTRLYTSQLNKADERMIPYDDVLKYPTDWPEISATRDQTVQQERGDTNESRAVQASLDRTLPEVHFDGAAFSDVIDFLRDVSGANVYVNWKSLEGAGIDKNAPVTTNLRNVKFSTALKVILDSVGGATTKLGYTIEDGVITISTGDDLSKVTLTRVYDIRDLIINVPDFTDAPDFSLNSTSNNQNQNPQGGGGIGQGASVTQANTLFDSSTSQSGGQREKPGPTRQELVDQITKLITDTVAPDSWRDSGGTVGALKELQGNLIVTQTPENQKALVNLLDQLRETRAIQVTVETRFLTVQRNFLEDVGVDLNMIFNLNGSMSKNISQIPVSSTSDAFTAGPTTSVPGSIGTTATSLTTSATYLDDFQVSMIVRATQATVQSLLVQAPRVTLFNGQRAYVLVSTQQAYVSNLVASVGTGVSAFTPQISIIDSGVLLDVTATVSADRKYVTLTLRPQLATLLDLKSFNFQSGAAGGGGIGIPGLGTIGGGTPGGTIQEPEIQITEVKTTVSVPDGGTLLLGGQSIAGETEKEAGVPVLSKIPFLKRLFTNRSMAKDEQVLLILVKPTIIIEKEIEQKQFPLLTSKLGA